MKIDRYKLEVILARKCISANNLRNSGFAPSTIGSIMNDERNIRPATVGKLARALGVDVTEILKEDVKQ